MSIAPCLLLVEPIPRRPRSPTYAQGGAGQHVIRRQKPHWLQFMARAGETFTLEGRGGFYSGSFLMYSNFNVSPFCPPQFCCILPSCHSFRQFSNTIHSCWWRCQSHNSKPRDSFLRIQKSSSISSRAKRSWPHSSHRCAMRSAEQGGWVIISFNRIFTILLVKYVLPLLLFSVYRCMLLLDCLLIMVWPPFRLHPSRWHS